MDPDIQVFVNAAAWAGAHALPLFLTGWAVLLTGCWLTWRVVQRHALPRLANPAPPLLRLGVGIAAGFIIVVAGCWIFAELADEVSPDEDLGHIDNAFTDALAASAPALAIRIFSVVTHLGDVATLTVFCILMAVVLIIRGRRWLAFAWAVSMGGTALLITTLKPIFERVRPSHDITRVIAEGYSFPSGHSTGAIVAYGMLAYMSLRFLPARWHLPALLSLASLAYIIGSSRIFLRAHFVSDVVAGFAIGSVWLAVCITSIELARWHRGRATKHQLRGSG